MISNSKKAGDNNDSSAVKDNKSGSQDELQHKTAAASPCAWMEKIKSRQDGRTVSANELTSLSALIAYTAHKTGISEFRIERDLADRFNVANTTCLPAAHFDEALRYLVDRVSSEAA